MKFPFGHPVMICYGPEGDGAGGGGTPGDGGAGDTPGDGGQQQQQVVAPWAGTSDTWSVGDKPWWDTIQEPAVKELMSQKAYKNPAELAMAYHNANKMISGSNNVVAIPGDDASPEELQSFHAKLGRPQNAADYKFEFGEGVQTDEKMLDFGRNLAFELGLNPKQAQAMANKWNEYVGATTQEMQTQAAQQNDQAIETLKGKWGAEFDANVEAGKRVYKSLGLDAELVNSLEAHVGAAPVVELLARIGKATGEQGLTSGSGGSPNDPNSMSPQQATAEIARLQSDPGFQAKYTDARHAEHKTALKHMEQLFARAG